MLCGTPALRGVCWTKWDWTHRSASFWIRPTSSPPKTIDQQDKIIGEAIDLLGGRVIGVQAKDVVASGYSAPGAGLMDYPAVFAQLAGLGPVPVIVQDASEDDAAQVRADMVRWYAEASVR